MDSFTETILARARERQKMLTGEEKLVPLKNHNKTTTSEPNLTVLKEIPPKESRSESNIASHSLVQGKENFSQGTFSSPLSITRVSSDIQGSPGAQMKTLNIQRDNFNMEIKVHSAENVRLEVEIEEHDDESEENRCGSEENVGLRAESKDRFKRLGKLYAGGDEADISSPIHRTEAKFYKSMEENPVKKDTRLKKGISKLADLANTINQWEDDLSHPVRIPEKKPVSPRKAWKAPAPQPPVEQQASSPQKHQKYRAPSPPKPQAASPKRQQTPLQRDRTFVKEENTPSSPVKEKFEEKSGSSRCQINGVTPKQISWDKKVLDTLESQGFTRTESSSRLVYAYNSQQDKKGAPQVSHAKLDIKQPISEEKEQQSPKSPEKSAFRSGAIANRAAMFEQKVQEVQQAKPTKDPALLTLAERKALFEKNKGEALIPKAAFGMSAPVKADTTMKASESKLIRASKNKEVQPTKIASKVVATTKSHPSPPPVEAPKTKAVVHQAGGIASRMASLLESKSTISEEQISNKLKEERQKEMDMLLNRFNRKQEVVQNQDAIEEVDSDCDDEDETSAMLKEKPTGMVVSHGARKSAEKRKSGSRNSTEADSPHVVSVLDEVKRIKVIAPKCGMLYPNLSDIEATTTDQETRTPTPNEENSARDNNYDSDDPNTSFGRDILETVCKNITPNRRIQYPDGSSSSENSSVMDELDEILEEMDDESSTGPTPPKQGRHLSPKSKSTKPQPSNSFHYKSFTSNPPSSEKQAFQSPRKSGISPRQSTELPLVVDGENVMTLTHTVSFYRKQQNEVHTPVRQIIRHPVIEESSESECDNTDSTVQQKTKGLQEEVNKQQNIISQTSQALNLCSSTLEFSGSTEQVEAERVLLVASHRRRAALHELQRLRVEGTIRPLSQHSRNLPLEKGTLTISNIVLPLKQKYVTALAAAGGKGHHVVCLIKCGEQVMATKLVSTVASNSKNPDVDLYIPGTITFSNIYSDFTITFEVYCLQAQEECLPHEVKYHINNKKSSKGSSTPKKNKQDSRLLRPPKESPAGPQAVRTSSFALMGYVVFSVQAVNKKVWSLNNTPPMSPLEGSVEMKIHCELAVSVEHRGFLTMFEDVSGFGAWHRRWCLLKGDALSYWKYPDEEKKQPPIDTIHLRTCITKEVKPVSREICARLHTFLLERERPAEPKDKDTLVVVRNGDKTIIRHLLSADTKEERIEWCKKLNSALTALRMWGNKEIL